MVRSPCGKCSCTSNLFHLLWSNYQPHCLWLVDYPCPAPIAASPDRHTAISHFTIWSQPPRMSLPRWWGALWSQGYHGWQKGFVLSLPSPWGIGFNGNTDTELNHRAIILAKCTNIINPRYSIHWGTAKRKQWHHESSSHMPVSNIHYETGYGITEFPVTVLQVWKMNAQESASWEYWYELEH